MGNKPVVAKAAKKSSTAEVTVKVVYTTAKGNKTTTTRKFNVPVTSKPKSPKQVELFSVAFSEQVAKLSF